MKFFSQILFIVIIFWSTIDFITTNIMNLRGFSKFYVSHKMVGHMNKPNFNGRFGGPLDEFNSLVNIGKLGERYSKKISCKNSKKILFLGDSIVAGFEVNDNETFVSLFNKNCEKSNLSGYNFGVRAYDTHQVIGTYKRISNKINHDYIFYLISRNDLKENRTIYHYKSFVEKFGRVYDEKFYKPEISNMKKFYYGLRIFISDNFYFTSKLIMLLGDIDNIFANIRRLDIKKIHDTPHVKINYLNIERTIDLINILHNLAKKNKKEIFVGFSPCLSEECDYEIMLEKIFSEQLKKKNKDIKIFPIVKQFEKLSTEEDISKVSMRFNRDFHLSKIGHEITYNLIVNNLEKYKMLITN